MSYFEATGTPAYSEFIYKSKYSKWLEEEVRRESWPETTGRYISWFQSRFPEHEKAIGKLKKPIENFEVMPSMRAMQCAGDALDSTHVANFNCAYAAVDHPRIFDEAMFILMNGCGLGFSVERQFVNKLPTVSDEMHPTDTVIHVRDSRIGWAKAFKELISLLYSGQVPRWDVSGVRLKGARLKTFGGRASGPAPLVDLFNFTVATFSKAKGRKLNSLECHDLMCKIGDVVVAGGTRRSALLSLSNLSDDRMRGAKTGDYRTNHPHRDLSNNSVCYTEKPDLSAFMDEWMSMYRSYSGERGIFNRTSADLKVAENGRRETGWEWGCNPCSEILLRSMQMCNLSEVVVRFGDTLEDLLRKVEVATILGTLQSTVTEFKYLRKKWQQNCEEERLLGVSLTGIMDHAILGDHTNPELPEMLEKLRDHAIEVNKKWAKKLGINQSTAVTAVKPSGTVSQLVNSASGIHPRYSTYYIRRVRIAKTDPVFDFLSLQGVPVEDDVHRDNTAVFSFPIHAPEGAVTARDMSALDQLNLWKIYQDHWCEHKPSCTVYYSDDEFLAVGAWIWENFDSISGISFLPREDGDHVYQQAPYERIDKDAYEQLRAAMPAIDWGQLPLYEKEDTTTSSHELACVGNVCELVDIES